MNPSHLKNMKIPTIIKALAAAGALFTAACKPPAEGTDSHAGHDHGAEGDSHVQGGICQEHNVPEDACGICNPDKVAGLKPGESMQLRLPSGRSADVAGVRTARPAEGMMADGLVVQPVAPAAAHGEEVGVGAEVKHRVLPGGG